MDVEVVETGNGGDLVKKGKDLSVVLGLENMVYLGMFGGNVEGSTPTERDPAEQAFDYWGNSLLWTDEPSLQMNSITESTLNQVALSSSGRLQIEQAVKTDLAFMSDFANVSVSATIEGIDRIKLSVKVVKPDNLEETEFVYIWEQSTFVLQNPKV